MYMSDLAATGQEWYQRAKRGIQQYETLINRILRIANLTARKTLLDSLGDRKDSESLSNRYEWARYGVSQVESFVPLNYAFFDLERRQKRIGTLEELVTELVPKVDQAERTYGILPDPVVTEKEVIKVIEREKVVETTRVVGEEFLGLPVRTWLWITGGTAAFALGVVGFIALTAKPKARLHARPSMAGVRRRSG